MDSLIEFKSWLIEAGFSYMEKQSIWKGPRTTIKVLDSKTISIVQNIGNAKLCYKANLSQIEKKGNKLVVSKLKKTGLNAYSETIYNLFKN